MLLVKGLNLYYGRSHALQGVDLTLGHGVLSVVGRNGMGKTTLCKAIVGLTPVASGSIRFMGEELVGRTPADIARLGVGYVPQGRRLWPSLTVDEHLQLASGGNRANWTIPRIYEAFPRLAERRMNRGNQLSGGEQQMLAIARALMMAPRLLVLDEPSFGLAPRIVEDIFTIIERIRREQQVSVLLVEQNASLALELADRAYLIETGYIVMSGSAKALADDPQIRRSYLGY
jgi:ABC-type branched-subunit amino acid transport system ATPase component